MRVILADQTRVAFAETVEEGLRRSWARRAPPPEEPGPAPSPGESPEPSRPPTRSGFRRLRRPRGGGRPPVRRGPGRICGRRPRHLPGAHRRAGGGAGRLGRARRARSWRSSSSAPGGEHALAWRLARDEGVRRVRIGAWQRRDGRRSEVELDPTTPGGCPARRRERYDLVVIGPEAPLAAGWRTSSHRLASPSSVRGVPPPGWSRARPLRSARWSRPALRPRHHARSPIRRLPSRASYRLTGRPSSRPTGSPRARMWWCPKPPKRRGRRSRPVRDGAARAHGRAGGAARAASRSAPSRWSATPPSRPGGRTRLTLSVGDTRPNTGGMGASPRCTGSAPAPSAHGRRDLRAIAWRMARDGATYRGVLRAGLMLTAAGPMVLSSSPASAARRPRSCCRCSRASSPPHCSAPRGDRADGRIAGRDGRRRRRHRPRLRELPGRAVVGRSPRAARSRLAPPTTATSSSSTAGRSGAPPVGSSLRRSRSHDNQPGPTSRSPRRGV